MITLLANDQAEGRRANGNRLERTGSLGVPSSRWFALFPCSDDSSDLGRLPPAVKNSQDDGPVGLLDEIHNVIRALQDRSLHSSEFPGKQIRIPLDPADRLVVKPQHMDLPIRSPTLVVRDRGSQVGLNLSKCKNRFAVHDEANRRIRSRCEITLDLPER